MHPKELHIHHKKFGSSPPCTVATFKRQSYQRPNVDIHSLNLKMTAAIALKALSECGFQGNCRMQSCSRLCLILLEHDTYSQILSITKHYSIIYDIVEKFPTKIIQTEDTNNVKHHCGTWEGERIHTKKIRIVLTRVSVFIRVRSVLRLVSGIA